MKLYIWSYLEHGLNRHTQGLLVAHATSAREAREFLRDELEHRGHWDDAIAKVLRRRPHISEGEVAEYTIVAGSRFT